MFSQGTIASQTIVSGDGQRTDCDMYIVTGTSCIRFCRDFVHFLTV